MLEPGPLPDVPPPARRIFCNRTLNLRSIKAIGYDMDYTLIHYQVEEWERRAYEYIKIGLAKRQWPVDDLEFDAGLVIRGLVVDTELGNAVKANRFGYVKQACHGTRMLAFDAQRDTYSRTRVALSNPRFTFLNTLFSLSEGCLFLQLVDRFDAGGIEGIHGYDGLWKCIRAATDAAHMEGRLKSEIIAKPDRFVDLDPDAASALLDQKAAGKLLLLITNSEWLYTDAMMRYAIEPYLPSKMKWRELFDVVIVGARKPAFFSDRNPLFEVVDDAGLLRPSPEGLRLGATYLGGSAGQVEEHLGLRGDEILYVGDHMYADVYRSKIHGDWRTALVLRELEPEVDAVEGFKTLQAQLDGLMGEKEALEHRYSLLRLRQLQLRHELFPDTNGKDRDLGRRMAQLREQLVALDERITPIARASNELSNHRWGLLLRAGNDKSHLARQLERYADVYTSRVSNFRFLTPFVYLRSPRGSLPHDPDRVHGL